MNNDMLPVGTTVHINPEDIKWECNGGDLISRRALKKSIKSYADDQYAENEYLGEYAIMNIIDKAPAVEYTFEEAFQKTVCENKLYCPARPQGEWVRKKDVIQSIAKQYSEHNEVVPVWLSIGDIEGGAE